MEQPCHDDEEIGLWRNHPRAHGATGYITGFELATWEPSPRAWSNHCNALGGDLLEGTIPARMEQPWPS